MRSDLVAYLVYHKLVGDISDNKHDSVDPDHGQWCFTSCIDNGDPTELDTLIRRVDCGL